MVMMASSSGPNQSHGSRSAEDLWEIALGKLKAEHKSVLQITRTNRLEILGEVLSLVQKTEHTCQKKRWKWKNEKGEFVIVQDIFTKMVVWIEKFKGIGDTVVQYDPGHAALPWAAVRLVLQATVNDVQTNRAMVEGLEFVFNLIAKFGVVERLYLQRQSSLQTRLHESIVALYASVLEYLIEAQRYFSQKTIVRIARSIVRLEEVTTNYTTDIKMKSNTVEEYVRLISGEIINSTDDRLGQFDGRLTVLDLRLRKLDNIDARSERIQDCSEEEGRKLRKILKDLHEPITRIATQLSQIKDGLKQEERLKIFEWLSTVPYMSHHRSKAKMLLPGSGAWLLRKAEFVQWMGSSTSSILWLHGIPGSGKSMLVAHVIEYIRGRITAEGEQTSLAYFYCTRNANEPERSDPVELSRSIAEQLSCSDEDSPIRLPVLEAYTERKKEARGRRPEKLGLEDSVQLILTLLETNPATIVIDGLDECDPSRRQNLLNALQEIITKSNNVVKVFVSSRDDHDIVHRLSQTPNLYIQAADNMEDIRKFVISSVDEAIAKDRILCGKVSWELRATIVNTLIMQAKGMFRLVSLHIDSLCNPGQIKTNANVLDSLEHLPVDLKLSYDSILTQISHTQHPNPLLAERILKWLLCAREPLRSKTFTVAVCSDMDDHELLQLSDILSICCNLVIYDSETDRFQFAHLSVREHLEHLDSYSTMKANALAAEQCLSWFFAIDKFKNDWSRMLMFQESVKRNAVPFCKEIRAGRVSLLDLETFWQHADTNWTGYAQHAGPLRKQGRLQSLLQEFLLFDLQTPRRKGLAFAAWVRRTYEDHVNSAEDRRLPEQDYVANFYLAHMSADPLFVACTFNFHEIVLSLINGTPWNLNCGQAAVVYNSFESIEVILDSLAKSHLLTPDYLTMLVVEAASLGHHRLLSAMLARGAQNFFKAKDLRRLIQETCWRNRHLDGKALQILSENSQELQVTESVLEPVFECDIKAVDMLRKLFRFSNMVELTEGLLGIALHNQNLKDNIVTELLQSTTSIYMSPEVIRRIFIERRWTSMVFNRWNRIMADMETKVGSKYSLRMWMIPEIVKRAQEIDLPLHEEHLVMLMHDMDRQLLITWDHLHKFSDTERGREYLLLMLEAHGIIPQSALDMLVASWDDDTVRMVLRFQSIEITDDIIRAAAGNLRYGKDIIELLLAKEMEAEEADATMANT